MLVELLNTRIVLTGTGEPQITFLKGGLWGTERTQGIFKGSRWTIFPNGTFWFQPPATADVRDDLYPITRGYEIWL